MDLFNNLVPNIRALSKFKKDIINSLIDKGATVTGSFLDYANIIYNLGKNTEIPFITNNFIPLPMSTQESSIMCNLEQMGSIHIAIINSLRARSVEFPDTPGFSSFSSFIDVIGDESPQIKILDLSIRNEVNNMIMVTVNNREENSKLYYSDSPYFPNATSQLTDSYEELTESAVTVNSYITVVELDQEDNIIGMGFKQVSLLNNNITPYQFTVSSTQGSRYETCCLSFDEEDEYNYYYTDIKPRKYNYLESIDPNNLGWTEVYNNAEIDVAYNKTGYFFKLDNVNRLVAAGSAFLIPKYRAPYLDATSAPGTELFTTKITTNNILGDQNKYLYKEGSYQLSYGDILDESWTLWDGESDIHFDKDKQRVTLVESTEDNTVVSMIDLTVRINIPEIADLSVTTVRGVQINESIVTLNTELPEGSRVYYKESEFGYNPAGEYIDSSYTEWDKQSSIYSPNGTIMLFVVADDKDYITHYAITRILSKVEALRALRLVTEKGKEIGFTKITVMNEKLNPTNIYKYAVGTVIVALDMEATDEKWNDWDGLTEIGGIEDGGKITVVECTSNNLVKRVGLVACTIKEPYLVTLELFSRRGSTGGYTNIKVNTPKSSNNHYVYNINVENVEELQLYDDMSEWEEWDGSSDIPADVGAIITIAEVDSSNLLRKIGSIEATINMNILSNITLHSTEGDNSGYTKISIEEPLEEGYHYVYRLSDEVPEYHEDVSSWNIFRINQEIEAENDQIVCIVVSTADNCAVAYGMINCLVRE